MQYREVARVLGKYLFYFPLVLLIPTLLSIYYEFFASRFLHPQPHATLSFLITIAICLIISGLLTFFGKKATGTIYRRESIFLVVSIWIVTSVISACPFYFSKTLQDPVDAYFEAISALTTTGSTMILPKKYNDKGQEIPHIVSNPYLPAKVYEAYGTITPVEGVDGKLLTGYEAVGRALLLWRSFLQWVGGLGIIVIFLSILPALGIGGKYLFQMETTGPVKEAVAPRIKQTASLLWKLYVGLTIVMALLLIWTNEKMPIFDAICLALSTISTGGYTIHDGSIAYYNNPWTEGIIILFMLLGSINFVMYFYLIQRKWERISKADFALFFSILFLGSMLISGYLWGTLDVNFPGEKLGFGESIRKGVFQTVAAQTTTGFYTANYDLWPFPSQMFMLLLMFAGGMAGSTSGGIKTPRFYILYKILSHKVESLFRPDSVRKVVIGKSEVDQKTYSSVLTFFCIVAFISILSTVCYVLDGIDTETAFGLTACMVNNIGIAFRFAGPVDNLNFLSPVSKILSTLWMLFGRLEFFSVLLLFFPSFWRGR
jgi:trk system potassium uptake protein